MIRHSWAMAIALIALGFGGLTGCAGAPAPKKLPPLPPATSATLAVSPAGAELPFIRPVGDPIEPVNRAFFGFNNVLIDVVINPFEHLYRLIFPEPVRRHITKAGYNLNYPTRLLNTLLQGKFKGAGVETGRFLVNSTVGLLGFFDPATRWGMANYNEDFGQTLGYWGLGQGFFLDLPLKGPSGLRDTLAGPLSDNTWYAGYFFMLNELSFALPLIQRVREMEFDPYSIQRDMWAMDRERLVRDYDQDTSKALATVGPAAPGSTLNVLYLRPTDPRFYERAGTRSVRIKATRRRLPYSCWIQKKPAPLVFVIPGVGSHRLTDSAVALAESLWKRGFSVVTVSNAMNWEFIEHAGTVTVPGFTPIDASDVHQALIAIYQDLRGHYPKRFTSASLIGLSLGAVHALFIADAQAGGHGPQGLRLDRIVAINPPVDVMYALKMVDKFYDAPLAWPEAERRALMEAALLKVLQLVSGKPDLSRPLPFSRSESEYLVGYAYRLILRDVIYSSQKKHDLGVIEGGFGYWNRQETYDRITSFSYTDYVRQFVLPYFLKRQERLTEERFIRNASLRSIEPGLRDNPRVRVFVNRDDFILGPGDVEWLQATFNGRLTVFENGGHLGNLYRPDIRDQVLDSLLPLKK